MSHSPKWAERVAREYAEESEHEESQRVLLDASARGSAFEVAIPDEAQIERADEVGRWLTGGES